MRIVWMMMMMMMMKLIVRNVKQSDRCLIRATILEHPYEW
jgi:hypothetical protein